MERLHQLAIISRVKYLPKYSKALIIYMNEILFIETKPANILLKKCDQKGLCVKIADFGIMVTHKFTGQSHTANQGTYHYMAPEVKYEEYGTKSDIYSLGVIFKELIDCKTDE